MSSCLKLNNDMPNKKVIIILILIISIFNPGIRTYSENGSGKRLGIYQLRPFERAVLCIKYYEGFHTKKNYPYIGYGHRLRPGERLNSNITEKQADSLLRSDLKRLCVMFRRYGKDSLLLAALSYNVGPYKVLGNSHHPKSRLLKKIESGNRNIYHDFVDFCRWKGKKYRSIRKRRQVELILLFQKE